MQGGELRFLTVSTNMATKYRQKTPISKWWSDLRRISEIEVQVRRG
jgi:hypothetical protein